MSDNKDSNVNTPELSPALKKQAESAIAQGKADSIDAATREALLTQQDKNMHNVPGTSAGNPQTEDSVEEVEVESVDEDEDEELEPVEGDVVEIEDILTESLSDLLAGSSLVEENTSDVAALLGGSFETIKPNFILQLMVPLIFNESEESLVVEDEEGQEWTFANSLAQTGREGKKAGVLYDSLVGLLERIQTLNASNFLIAGNDLTRATSLDSLAQNFVDTNAFELPTCATEDAFESLVGFLPALGATTSQDGQSIVVNMFVPMPIIASGKIGVVAFLTFLKKIVSKFDTPVETLFLVDPIEMVYNQELVENVRALDEAGFDISTLETFVEEIESVDLAEDWTTADDDNYEDDIEDADEDEDDDDEDEDEDEVVDEEVEESDEDASDSITMPGSTLAFEQTAYANGISSMGTILLTKKL